MNVTTEFKEKLVSAKGHKYIHKGYMKFNSFRIEEINGKMRITCYHKDGTPLCYFEGYYIPDFGAGETLTFVIDEGLLKVHIT